MSVFISYSHADNDVAETLALHLVQAKQNVWIDTWELNAGDSPIAKIECEGDYTRPDEGRAETSVRAETDADGYGVGGERRTIR